MFKKILFATTASPVCDEAAKVAFDLAGKYGASIKVLHVYGLPSHGFSTEVKEFRSGQEEFADADHEKQLADELRASCDHLMGKVSDCDVAVRTGVPQTEILRVARKWECDLIVMGAHTRMDETGALRYRNIVGNTMQKVAKSSKAPVLIVSRPCTSCFWYFENVIFGTDLSKASDAAFAFALKTAKESGAKLYIFHALEIEGISAGLPENQVSLEERLTEARTKIKERYLTKAGGFDNIAVEVWEGTPYVEILKFTRERKGDLIVMAHHGKRRDEEADMGSTVEQVVLRSSCPVVSVNHEDRL
ncbi:universal stress protein [Desulfoluna limicola]|uniref:Universal stress protein n=1 Tax=Desulfoluna limicola TaxID=2810562 RepID=A0ABM7PEN0_9BACT|nr:universal stress protein [Desulfoluna limicola]BCS95636.1 universal stress protein [Desulfoluna limicola]